MYRSALFRCFLFLLALASSGFVQANAASSPGSEICGTYPGRVLTELALHRQYVNQRIRQGYVPQAVSQAVPVDEGHIAVLPDDGTLVIPANAFDLDQRTLNFLPTASGFTVSAGPVAFDTEAAASGILLNPPPANNPANIGDDGARQVSVGFSFPYFGRTHSAVFINSDGNLTFLEGDTATTQRSLVRFLSGPPRIAPYFADLDPSVAGRLTYFSSSSRFVVTWSEVPDYSSSGIGPRETFQVMLSPDGRIQFAYSGINGRESVVGVSPGAFTALPNLLDLSGATGTSFVGPGAEVFSASTRLDLAAVSQRFYRTHEDAYDIVVVFTNFDFDLSGAFAFEVNIANQVTGIGRVAEPPVFDFSSQFGSFRLQSLLNMGNLSPSRYPPDPSTVFLRGVDSTLSVLGHEAGHRFLAYVTFSDPEDSPNSTALLGRDLQHWSFFFNSDASVMEGNRIHDNGDGTFTTIGAVEHYNEIDQYLMGLRAPGEVGSTFLVKEPGIPSSPARAPALNVSFPGRRANVLLQQIIDANGPRVPNVVISPKRFNFAFVLVAARGSSPSQGQITQLDAIRRGWESFFAQATSLRGVANTSLIRGLRLTPHPLGLLSGTQSQGKVELLATASSEVAVTLTSSNALAVGVPSRVVIPGGAQSATFPIAALSPGRASVTASASGFETGTVVVDVVSTLATSTLSLSVTGGDRQVGQPGDALPTPLRATLRDSNQIPFAGVPVEFAVSQGSALLQPPAAMTDAQGNASTVVTLGDAVGAITVLATVPGTSLSARFSLLSLGTAEVPQAGIVNGASFAPAPAPVSPGSIVSIFGTNLSASTAMATSLPLPTRLASTTVEIGGSAAPLFYVSPTQINAQVPTELTGSTAFLLVRNEISSSTPVSVSLSPVGPGIFTQDSSGRGPGAITFATSQLPVTISRPVTVGDFVQIFATGLGSVVPTVASGRPAPPQPLSQTTSEVAVRMNGIPARVVFAGLAPGFVGVYQVNAQVPEGITGTVEVLLTINGVASNPVTMEVR